MSRAAPWPRATLAQVGMEARLTARRGENVLALIGIPAAVLLFFGSVDLVPVPAGQARIDVLLPGTLALAVIAAGLVNLGIATAYERAYGVLKRLGGSPLGRSGLVSAKLATVLLVEVVVALVLVALAAVVFGWRPSAATSWPAVAVTLLVGTARVRRHRAGARGHPAGRGDADARERAVHRLPVARRGRRPGGSPRGAAGHGERMVPRGRALRRVPRGPGWRR